MKKVFGVVLAFWVVSNASWSPDVFIIGSFNEPPFLGNSLTNPHTATLADINAFKDYRSLGFNMLIGSIANAVQDPWGSGYTYFSWDNKTYNPTNTAIQGPVDAVYRLNVLCNVDGLRTFIWNRDVFGGNNGDIDIALNFFNILSTFYPVYTSQMREKVFGYFLGNGTFDETNWTTLLNSILPIMQELKNYSTSQGYTFKPALTNIGDIGDGLAQFTTNLGHFLSNSNSSIFAWDYYKFTWQYEYPSGTPLGPFQTPTFFEHLKNIAVITSTNNKIFLGVPYCADDIMRFYQSQNVLNSNSTPSTSGVTEQNFRWRQRSNFNSNFKETFNPSDNPINEAYLRHEAHCCILYGAKGLIWYNYQNKTGQYIIPDNKGTNTGFLDYFLNQPSDPTGSRGEDIKNNLKKINLEIEKMGPILLQLKWENIVHGSEKDPLLGETGLNTIDHLINSLLFLPLYQTNAIQAINPSSHASTSWKKDSLAIGIFSKNSFYYLAIMNKSLSNGNLSLFNCKGNVYPRLFDKTNGGWKMLSSRVYHKDLNYTSFELGQTLNPGDMQLVWLGPADLSPILNLLLGD